LRESREDSEKTKSVYDVLMQENYEIFEAIQDNNLINARQEIYDTIAVLLRLDKVLQEKQRNEDFKRNDIPFYENN
jgi:NTP pyrophosphatase (non-canonical NTP hydrolase)